MLLLSKSMLLVKSAEVEMCGLKGRREAALSCLVEWRA